MRAVLRRTLRLARRLIRDQAGVASVEFVVLTPVFLLVMINSIEASVLMMRATLLDRGLDMAMRELRINTDSPPTYDSFRAKVCEHAAMLDDCIDTLQVELSRIDLGDTAAMETSARCAANAHEFVPLVEVDPDHYAGGTANELMMVRACLYVSPIVPNLGLAALLPSDQGGFRLVSVSAFVQEPTATAGAGT